MSDPKVKRDEQKSLLELLDDTIFELKGVLGSLKEQLLSETSYTEGEEKEASLSVVNIQKEISLVEKQIKHVNHTKDNVAIILQQIEEEKKKKEMEETLKGVLIVGAINEFVRKKIAMEEEADERFMSFDDYTVAEENRIIEDLFKRKDYRYVTKEDVETIKQDKELNEMAIVDPFKLEKEALFLKDKYERMMERYMIQSDLKNYGDTFEEKERNFIELLKSPNHYEKSLSYIDKDFKESREVVEKTLNEEELKTYDEICEGIRKLAKTTRRRQNEFVKGESSFKKGNKYTEKLIKDEKQLYDKIAAFKEALEKKSMALIADENLTDPKEIYFRENVVTPLTHITMFEGPLKAQYERDAVFLENRGMRIREEKWDVYKNIPSKRRTVKASTRRMSRTQSIALTKGDRIVERSSHRGPVVIAAAELAKNAADSMVGFLNANKGQKLPVSDLEMVKQCMATIVLYQIIYEEEHIHPNGYTPNRDRLVNAGFGVKDAKDTFIEMAHKLSESPVFNKAIKKIKGKSFEEKCERFWATDEEKEIAKQFKGKDVTSFKSKESRNDSLDRSMSISK